MKRHKFKITKEHLTWLAKRAEIEHNDFLERKPHLRAYKNSLVGIVLCQGAALHYIDGKNGIKDFDIWFFYQKDEKVNLSIRRPATDKNGYNGIRIDFMKRAIPASTCKRFSNQPDQCILNYLLEHNTLTKRLLLEKPGIGLYPKKIFAKIIWIKKRSLNEEQEKVMLK